PSGAAARVPAFVRAVLTGNATRYRPQGVAGRRLGSAILTSHSLMISSRLPEASVSPSLLKATEVTSFVCPRRVERSLPVRTSQSLTVWSRLADARVCPSPLKATDRTVLACPFKRASSLPVLTSQTLIGPSVLAAASV